MTFARKFLVALAAATTLTAGAASASTVIFSDDFNRSGGNTLGNGWTELEESGNDVAINGNRMRIRDNQSGSPDAAAATAMIDASGLANVTLAFDWNAFSSIDADDYLFVSWSLAPLPALTDLPSWTQVFQGSDPGGTSGTLSESISLGGGVEDGVFHLMFWTTVSSSAEGFFVDNVVVTGDVAPPVGQVPLPAAAWMLISALGGLVFAGRRRKTA